MAKCAYVCASQVTTKYHTKCGNGAYNIITVHAVKSIGSHAKQQCKEALHLMHTSQLCSACLTFDVYITVYLATCIWRHWAHTVLLLVSPAQSWLPQQDTAWLCQGRSRHAGNLLAELSLTGSPRPQHCPARREGQQTESTGAAAHTPAYLSAPTAMCVLAHHVGTRMHAHTHVHTSPHKAATVTTEVL